MRGLTIYLLAWLPSELSNNQWILITLLYNFVHVVVVVVVVVVVAACIATKTDRRQWVGAGAS